MNQSEFSELNACTRADDARTSSIPQAIAQAGKCIGIAVWLGLLAGLLELGCFLLIRARSGEVWPYFGKIRHYLWAIPLTNALLLVILALPFALLASWKPGSNDSRTITLLVACAIWPSLLVLAPHLYAFALLMVAMGIASLLVASLKNRPRLVRGTVRVSLSVLLLVVAGLCFWRVLATPNASKATTSPDRPNILLIVLDTVRADHMSLAGSVYPRETTPEIAEFARRGITFTNARSTAPWTLPAHATLMTGRWDFEVTDDRYGAMTSTVPTLAETLGTTGYDSVGIVANLFFCPYFTGIDRGFDRYEDIPTTFSTFLSASELGGRVIDALGRLESMLTSEEPRRIRRLPRIPARRVNHAFIKWLDHREFPDRPFFAFLNYFDAHDPYMVPEGEEHRFGNPPRSQDAQLFLRDWWLSPEKPDVPEDRIQMLIDGYDSCLASLDEHVGQLLEELNDRDLLENTIVVITSDHGEAFGEHNLFGHGGSLYEDQLHVPLVMVAPGLIPKGRQIESVVSLRDLPATILDLASIADHSLPGTSLATLWRTQERDPMPQVSPAIASVSQPEAFNPNEGRSPVFTGPMLSIVGRDLLKYVVTQSDSGDVEELYDLREDPEELRNLVAPSTREQLDQLRSLLLETVDSANALRAWSSD